MKKIAIFLLILPFSVAAQPITGKWVTIDDETGDKKSIVEIYEREGKIFGKVLKIFPGEGVDTDPVCKDCPEDDERYNRKVIGMEIIKDMERDGDEYASGTILDPKIGRVYRCRLWVEDDDLNVRGYWGPFFRTQVWKRAQ
jgi:uncharacterized protein (DUF2147 family)